MRTSPIIVIACSLSVLGGAAGLAGAHPRYQVFRDSSIVVDAAGDAAFLSPVLADANGDGVPDLLVLRRGESIVRALFSNGRARWDDPIVVASLPQGTRVQDVVAADLNGDGYTDAAYWAALGDDADEVLGVLLSDGAGGFSLSAPIPLDGIFLDQPGDFEEFDTLAAGDVTGDGSPDLVISSGSLVVLKGDGAGGFGEPSVIGFVAGAVELADIDGDGAREVASVGSSGLQIWEHRDDAWELAGSTGLDLGGYPPSSLASLPRCDGLPGAELYAASARRFGVGHLQPIVVAEDGALDAGPAVEISEYAVSIAAGDVLGQPAPDLILSSGEVLIDPSCNGIGAPVPFAWASFGVANAADLDLDGDLDIVVSERSRIGIATVEGDDAARAIPGLPRYEIEMPGFDGGFPGITSGDFDGDGRRDLFICTENNASSGVFYQEPDGSFTGVHLARTTRSSRAHAADLDADGLDDAVLITTGMNVQVNFAEPGRSFAPRAGFGVGPEPSEALTGDVDADGRLDIVALTAQGIVVLLQTGDRAFTQTYAEDLIGVQLGLAVGDLDGDGDADAVAAGQNGNEIRVAMSRGDGTLEPAFTIDASARPEAFDLADLDRDGDLDLIAASRFDEPSVTVYENDGAGGFTIAGSFGLSFSADFYGTQWVVARDVDLDGHDDIALANQIGVLEVLTGDGALGFRRAVENTTGSVKLNQFVIDDLNADGFPDAAVVAWRDDGAGMQFGGVELLPNLTTPTLRCPADFAAPIGALDHEDVGAFVDAFLAGDPEADLGAAFGLFDLEDLVVFLETFLAGCP